MRKSKFRIFLSTLLLVSISSVMIYADSAPPDMATVTGGSFIPLYGNKNIPREVTTFLLDQYPVTNAQFLAFVVSHPEWQRTQVKKIFAGIGYLQHWSGDTELGANAPPDSPVTNVSWFAARAYLREQGKRLPSEDEWEFAARADATKIDASTDPVFVKKLLTWYSRPGTTAPPSIKSLEKNVHGVYGMHGAVWEWVNDFNSQMVTGESRGDKTLDRSLFCGAGALNATDVANYAAFMRYAFRSSLKGSYCVGTLGFRGAKTISDNITK
jgi:formylglycine-generating enzyme